MMVIISVSGVLNHINININIKKQKLRLGELIDKLIDILKLEKPRSDFYFLLGDRPLRDKDYVSLYFNKPPRPTSLFLVNKRDGIPEPEELFGSILLVNKKDGIPEPEPEPLFGST